MQDHLKPFRVWTPAAVSGSFLPRMRFTLTSHQALIEANNALANMTFSRPLYGAIRIPVPKPIREPNRCNLEPFKPEMPKITLYLVLAQGRLTLQVVCLGLAHFQLPVRPPKSPSPPTGENPGRP